MVKIKNEKTLISLEVRNDQKSTLEVISEKNSRSVSYLIRCAIDEFIANHLNESEEGIKV